MKEKISRLARGIIDASVPEIRISREKIEDVIPCDGIYRGDFRIVSGNQLAFRGLIYSTNPKVRLGQDYFAGVDAQLTYEVETDRLKDGSAIEGSFLLVCNGGEFEIPYFFLGESDEQERWSSIHTAEDFAGLAKEDFLYAERLFESPGFRNLPFMQELSVRALYDGLRGGSGRRQAMEEFLTALNLKEPVTLSADQSERLYESCPEEDVKIWIHADSWGYVSASVTADAPFLHLNRESLTDLDFVGGDGELSFRIEREHLHQGRNYGVIRIRTIRQELAIPVTILAGEEPERGFSQKEYEKHLVGFMRAQLDLQSGCGEKDALLASMKEEWTAMARLREPDLRMRLWEAELALLDGRQEEAGRILRVIREEAGEKRGEDPDAYSYFLYLQMQQSGSWEMKERLLKLLYKYQDEGAATPVTYLLFLRVDDNRAGHPEEAFRQMQEFYQEGCRSPYLYLEAVKVLNRIPERMERLGEFELQLLWFGARHGYVEKPLMHRTAELTLREKTFRPVLYLTLQRFYETAPTNEIVYAVCAILIRGDRRDSSYFPWFARGVKADVGLTRLYDYYLYTRPEHAEEEIPRVILLYYSYNSPWDIHSRKVLYDYVLSACETDSYVYRAYEKQMQYFLIDQLLAGRVDDFLAHMYERLLYPELVDERIAKILPDVLKTCRIRIGNPAIRQLIVVYGERKEEVTAPVKDGVVYLPLYTEDCRLLFADRYGNRYASIPCEREMLMKQPEALLACSRRLYPTHAMSRLAECSRILREDEESSLPEQILFAESSPKILRPLYQRKLIHYVLNRLRKQEQPDLDLLRRLKANLCMSEEDRQVLIRVLIDAGSFSEAMEQMREYGSEKVPDYALLRLCSRTIQNRLYEKNAELLHLAASLFAKNQYDDTNLQYLCRYYNGLSRQMYEILEKSVSHRADTSDLAERLFGQILFTGEYTHLDDTFRIYIGLGPVEKLLVRAYFSVRCYGYFVEQKPLDADLVETMEEIVSGKRSFGGNPLICTLALTRWYSDQAELSENQKEICQEAFEQLYRRGLVFAYFKKLGRFFPLPEEIGDRTIVEYYGREEEPAEIVYRILPEMEDAKPVREEMTVMYHGIYAKPILLFSGEHLEYEIRVLRGGQSAAVYRGRKEPDTAGRTPGGRFEMLNRLLDTKKEPEDEEWQRQVRDYAWKDAMAEQLFCLERKEAPLDGGTNIRH